MYTIQWQRRPVNYNIKTFFLSLVLMFSVISGNGKILFDMGPIEMYRHIHFKVLL